MSTQRVIILAIWFIALSTLPALEFISGYTTWLHNTYDSDVLVITDTVNIAIIVFISLQIIKEPQ